MNMKQIATSILLAAAASALAAEKFAYKGQLERADGAAFAERLPTSMSFRLYDRASGGKPLWGRTMPVKIEADGSFYVELSDDRGSPSDPNLAYAAISDAFASGSLEFWIGLTPGAYSELSPRQKLAAVPRALHATSARKIDSLKTDLLVADAVAATCATAGVLCVTNSLVDAGARRDWTSPPARTVELSALNDAKIRNDIGFTGPVALPAGALPARAPCDMFVIWKSPASAMSPAALFYARGMPIRNEGGEAVIYKFGN